MGFVRAAAAKDRGKWQTAATRDAGDRQRDSLCCAHRMPVEVSARGVSAMEDRLLVVEQVEQRGRMAKGA